MNENNKRVEVDVRLQIKDVLRYNLFVAYHSWITRIILIIGLLIGGWLIYVACTSGQRFDLFLSENIIWIVVVGFAILATPLKVWGITATQMQSPIFSGTSHYVFEQEQINLKVGDLEDTVPWTTYRYIRETKKDFRLFVDAVQAQIIPKHNLTHEQVNELREIIKANNPESCYKLLG